MQLVARSIFSCFFFFNLYNACSGFSVIFSTTSNLLYTRLKFESHIGIPTDLEILVGSFLGSEKYNYWCRFCYSGCKTDNKYKGSI